MDRRFLWIVSSTIFTIFLISIPAYSAEVGVYEEKIKKNKKKLSAKEIEASASMLSYGSILRIKSLDTNTFLCEKDGNFATTEDKTPKTYWYIQPKEKEDWEAKKKHVIPSGSTILLINASTGKRLLGQSWIIEPQKTVKKYLSKDHTFVLKDPEDETLLSSSSAVLPGDSSLYKLRSTEKIDSTTKWVVDDYYPAMTENDLKTGDIVAIKCLANDRYMIPWAKVDVDSERQNHPNDRIIFENLVAPASDNPEEQLAKFMIVKKGGYIKFKSMAKWTGQAFIQSSSSSNEGWDRKFFWQQMEYHYRRGLLTVWNPNDKLERFRIEWPYIKDVSSKGYLTLIWDSIGKYLKSLGDRGRNVHNNRSPYISIPIVSAYDNVYFASGKPNKRSPRGLFVFIKYSGKPIMPIIPEEEAEEGEYRGISEEVEIKIDKPLKGLVNEWQNVQEPGIVEIVFDAKAIDNIMILFAPEKKEYKKGDKVQEIVIGGGIGKNSNSYSLIRNTHFGKVSDPKIGTFKMGKHIQNKNWNSYWVKIVGNEKQFGTGKKVGENIILKWTDPEEISVNFFGFSNYKNPVYIKNIKVSTPKVTGEIKAKFFKNKLKRIRKKKTFKEKVDAYLTLLTQAYESDKNRNAFVDEIVWLSENTPKDKAEDLQKLINTLRYTPKLINEDPLRDAVLTLLAIQYGMQVRFNKKVDALDNLLNLAYTNPDAKEFLTKHIDNIATQLRIIAEESLDEPQEIQDRVKVIIDTAKSDPIFEKHAAALSILLEDMQGPLTIEALQGRIEAQTATRTTAAEKRFVKTVKKIVNEEIKKIKKEINQGPLSDESVTTVKHIKYLLRSIIFGLKFDPKTKKVAQKLLENLPGIKTEITIEPVEEDASIEEKIEYIVKATTNSTLKSAKNKKPYFETLSKLVSEKNILTPTQVEQIRVILDMIKWHKMINDQEKALIKYYLSQLQAPVTLDDKINQLLKEVLLIKQDQGEHKKRFLNKIDNVIKLAETKVENKEKVDSLKKLQRLLKTIINLPQFQKEKKSVEPKLKKINELIKKQSGITEKKKEAAKAKETKKEGTKRSRRRIPVKRRSEKRAAGRGRMQRRVIVRR